MLEKVSHAQSQIKNNRGKEQSQGVRKTTLIRVRSDADSLGSIQENFHPRLTREGKVSTEHESIFADDWLRKVTENPG
jgi:hypothetical protein